MAVSYTLAVQQSWSRMVRMLFRPFRFETWFTLGFAAFLSEYLSHPGGGGSYNNQHGGWRVRHHGEIPPEVRHVAGFLLHPAWGVLVIVALTVAVICLLLFVWVSCRGKFVFLDNLAREKAAIVAPWKRYGRLGNSLFAFWLTLTVLTVGVGLAISLPVLIPVLRAVDTGEGWPALIALIAVWWVMAIVPFALVVGCTYLFLEQFVVPIMYREGLGVLAAWGRFFSLFGRHAASFIGFALFYFVISVVFGMAVVVGGFATCCVGFLLLSIPYVGSVVLLPIEVTLRGLGPDFLAQLGPEWSIFAPAAGAPAAPAPPAPPAPGAAS
jgi:hypothetical protein